MDGNKREIKDRRVRHASILSLRRLHGRRRAVRRMEDIPGYSTRLDWHSPAIFLMVLTLMILCVADAHNTLQLLRVGAEEANPIMQHLLQKGTDVFLAGKFGITAVGIVLLAALHHYPIIRPFHARHALYALLLLYLVLITGQVAVWPGEGSLFFVVPSDDH
ncbi:MAG: DUF5658 family protein [Nitrospirota bacterium]|nr:DUF5658 family protein [Nitrospirota bacterium]